jgi:hypothetical protein
MEVRMKNTTRENLLSAASAAGVGADLCGIIVHDPGTGDLTLIAHRDNEPGKRFLALLVERHPRDARVILSSRSSRSILSPKR